MHAKVNERSGGDSQPLPISDSYAVPGSSGTMKETHIFTPSKLNDMAAPPLVPTCIKSRPDGAQGDIIPGDSIVIKENVVKKEYRDIEYEPNKLVASADDFSDFSDFQFAPPTTITSISNAIEPNLGILKPELSTSFLPDLSNNNNGQELAPNGNHSNDFTTMKNVHLVDNHQNSLVDSLANLQNRNTIEHPLSNGYHNENEFGSLNENIKSIDNASGHSVEAPNMDSDPIEIYSIGSINPSNSFAPQQPSILNAQKAYQPPSFTNSSSILMPQTATAQLPQTSNNLTIQWPEPGIDLDQLAQLEQRFWLADVKVDKADTKPNDTVVDDEWSDFVSVVQPQTPITNILNKNLLKQQNNDEDDWSEFVSSTPSTVPRFQQNSSDASMTCEAVFASWNAPSDPSPATGSYLFPSQFVSACNSPKRDSTAFQAQPQSMTPSIISLPNMRFVAPKSLLNMPKRPLTKK